MKVIVPDSDTKEDDLSKVQEIVREHYRQHQGNVVLFGKVTGYLFVHEPTKGILLGVDGNVLDYKVGRFHPISISIQDRL